MKQNLKRERERERERGREREGERVREEERESIMPFKGLQLNAEGRAKSKYLIMKLFTVC